MRLDLFILAAVVIAVALAAWLSRPKAGTLAAVVEYRPAAGSFAATAPLIRGYNMPVSMSEELWSVITGRSGFNVYEGRTLAAVVEYRPAAGSFAATAPLIRGYNVPASMSEELWSVITGRSGFNVYEGRTLAAASPASAAVFRATEGSFADTAPLIRGYNMPVSMSEELWSVIKGRSGFNVYEGRTLSVASSASAAVEYRPAAGSFAATAPLIRGYNIPASMSEELWSVIKGRAGFNVYEYQTMAVASETSAAAYRPVEGSFAVTKPLIPGYTMPHDISLELWAVIVGRDGFNVYETR